MKYSGIGGQAVMEGVMMQNKDTYAVAVRKPDHEIDVKVSKRKNSKTLDAIRKIPILRGVVSFVDSLYLGMSTLMYSASFFEDEDDEGTLASKKKEEELTAEEKKKRAAKEKKQENAMLGGTVVLSIVIALALFFALPYFLSGFFKKVISSQMLIAFIEGVIRLAIFLGYIAIISLTPDIKRTFMYHGSEHKCINCIASYSGKCEKKLKASQALRYKLSAYSNAHKHIVFHVYPCGFKAAAVIVTTCAYSCNRRCIL